MSIPTGAPQNRLPIARTLALAALAALALAGAGCLPGPKTAVSDASQTSDGSNRSDSTGAPDGDTTATCDDATLAREYTGFLRTVDLQAVDPLGGVEIRWIDSDKLKSGSCQDSLYGKDGWVNVSLEPIRASPAASDLDKSCDLATGPANRVGTEFSFYLADAAISGRAAFVTFQRSSNPSLIPVINIVEAPLGGLRTDPCARTVPNIGTIYLTEVEVKKMATLESLKKFFQIGNVGEPKGFSLVYVCDSSKVSAENPCPPVPNVWLARNSTTIEAYPVEEQTSYTLGEMNAPSTNTTITLFLLPGPAVNPGNEYNADFIVKNAEGDVSAYFAAGTIGWAITATFVYVVPTP